MADITSTGPNPVPKLIELQQINNDALQLILKELEEMHLIIASAEY